MENIHVTAANAVNYESAAVPQSEVLQPETSQAVPENQYPFTSSAPGYNYENSQNLNATFSHTQASSQMQNLAAFSSVLVNGKACFPLGKYSNIFVLCVCV